MKLKKAIKVLSKALQDDELRAVWQANIAMAHNDYRKEELGHFPPTYCVTERDHRMFANGGAKRFLQQLSPKQ